MSEEGRAWCRERGEVLVLPPCDALFSDGVNRPLMTRVLWEKRYGSGIWNVRSCWMQKPRALLACPYSVGLWLDLDCQVLRPLKSLFETLQDGIEIGIARDKNQGFVCLMSDEVHYNSGVILFRKDAKILRQWLDVILEDECRLPGDQEFLSRAIARNNTPLFELPKRYHSFRTDLGRFGKDTVIKHFIEGAGKIAILKEIPYHERKGIEIPKGLL